MTPAAGALPAVLDAPAKLTWSLRITGVRPDGLHLLDAEMSTLALADRLELAAGDGLDVADPDGLAPGCPSGDENLVRRALFAAGCRAHVTLHKAIPDGAGLGGGSADAAAVLRWAGVTDPAAAARLGADVPFCLVGGRARVRGIGEEVEPLPPLDRTVTLCTPPVAVDTAAAYRAWDDLGGPEGEAGNDLEPAAVAVAPGLARWRDAIADATGQRPRLAGSGSTWFVEGHHGAAVAGLRIDGARPRLVAVTHTVTP